MIQGTDLFSRMLASVGPAAGERPGGLQVGARERIVAIGDSITQNGGYLRAMDAVFAQRYAGLKIPPIINVGISGQKAEDLVERFGRDVVDRRPAVTTISVGINDVWHRLEAPHEARVLAAYAENVERMIRAARTAGIRVYLVAPTVIEEDAGSEGNRRLAGYVAAGRDVARRSGCDYVDLHGLFLQAVASRADRVDRPAAPPLTRDGVHMEPPGDVLMAVGILRAWGVPDETMAATDVTGAFG